MRLDKYLKVSRLIKRRTVANEACDAERTWARTPPRPCTKRSEDKPGIKEQAPSYDGKKCIPAQGRGAKTVS